MLEMMYPCGISSNKYIMNIISELRIAPAEVGSIFVPVVSVESTGATTFHRGYTEIQNSH